MNITDWIYYFCTKWKKIFLMVLKEQHPRKMPVAFKCSRSKSRREIEEIMSIQGWHLGENKNINLWPALFHFSHTLRMKNFFYDKVIAFVLITGCNIRNDVWSRYSKIFQHLFPLNTKVRPTVAEYRPNNHAFPSIIWSNKLMPKMIALIQINEMDLER